MSNDLRRLGGAVVAILALLGIGASITYFLVEPYNPGFLRFPTLVGFHVVLGAVYLALAPLQFITTIRRRWPGYHRWVGRLLVAIGLVVGLTALFLGLAIPFSRWSERIVIAVFGGLYLVALAQGFVSIRARRTALHREWMIRAFAIGLSIATMRLIFVPALLLSISPSDQQIALLSVGSFSVSFLLHAALAELWIRATHRQGAVRVGVTSAALEIPSRAEVGRAMEKGSRMERANSLPLVWGTIAMVCFVFSQIPMLARALRTKDLRSYSLLHLTVTNLGNVAYWVYVSTLPFGPIWVMHAFYTLSTALMLLWYLRYRQRDPRRPEASRSRTDCA